jgi:hypothetical protein
MASIHIREIDPAFLREVKVAAAKRGQTLKHYVIAAVEMAVENDADLTKGRELQPLGKGQNEDKRMAKRVR